MLDDVQAALREAILTIHDLRAEMAKLRAERDERAEQDEAERDRLRAALADAIARMDRARGILRGPHANWGMLDTSSLQESLDHD